MIVTLQAVEQMSQHLLSALDGDDPFANHPGRIVTDMLIVAAGELRNPMTFVIDVVSVNRLLHRRTSRDDMTGLVVPSTRTVVAAVNAVSSQAVAVSSPGGGRREAGSSIPGGQKDG